MKKSRLLFAALISVVFFPPVSCQAFWFGSKTDSRWTGQALPLDGTPQKWRVREEDEDSGLAYAFANDSKNLYIMLSPHTRAAKDELAGSYGQDLTIWLDAHAGKGKTLGIRLAAPGSRGDQSSRKADVVGLDTAAVPVSLDNDGAEVIVGPVTERGLVEARIPLRYLGPVPPEKISVGIETSKAKEAPPQAGNDQGSFKKDKWASVDEGGLPDGVDSGLPAGMDNGIPGGAGGMPGGGMGRGHRGGGGGRQHSRAAQEEDLSPLSLWIRVTLAAPPKGEKN